MMNVSQLLPMVAAVADEASAQAHTQVTGAAPVWPSIALGVVAVAALLLWRRGA